jgi:phosphatidylglycerophosphate synthase
MPERMTWGMTDGPTLGELVAEYRRARFAREMRSDWAVALFYRLPSLPIIRVLSRTPVSPTMVTLAGIPVVVAMPLAALFMSADRAVLVVGLLAILFQVLDCVDGGLARATGRSSRLGGTVDYLVDMAQWGFLYASIGILADRAGVPDAAMAGGEQLTWTFVGVVAAWIRLFARVVRDAGPPPLTKVAGSPLPPLSASGVVLAFFAGLSGTIAPLVLLAGMTGTLVPLLVFLVVYAVADVIEGLFGTLRADASGDA